MYSYRITTTVVRLALAANLLTVFPGPPAYGASARSLPVDSCDSILPLEAEQTWQDPGVSGGSACFRIDTSEEGILALELGLPATSPGAHLVLAETSGMPSGVLHHSSRTLVLAAGPGSILLKVRADDRSEPLGPFSLRTARAPFSPVLRLLFGEGELDSEIELEPDPLWSPCIGQGELDSEIELEPDPLWSPCIGQGELDSEIELEPDPIVAPGHPAASDLSRILGLGREQRAALCAGGDGDHHADSFLCAAPLGKQAVEGRLDGPAVYRFSVRALGPVEIRADFEPAGGEAHAELFDRHGQRLELLSGDGAGIHRVRTLVPGRYFLRLEERTAVSGLRVEVPDER